jgi:hypothetical protein
MGSIRDYGTLTDPEQSVFHSGFIVSSSHTSSTLARDVMVYSSPAGLDSPVVAQVFSGK